MEMKIAEDRWLSEIFGHKVFKVVVGNVLNDVGEGFRRKLCEHVSAQRRAFYFAKVGTTEVGLVQGLCNAGFYAVDVNVIFSMGVDGRPRPTGAVVRECEGLEPDQRERLLDIAAMCFRYSRFHLDPLIPKTVANKVKRRWIENYVNGKRGEKLFVAFHKYRPVGFLAAMTTEYRGERHGTIDLIGVDPAFQGQGFGTALVNRFIDHYCRKTGSVLVGTQAANIPSLRFYAKSGFLPIESAYVLHAHVGAGDDI